MKKILLVICILLTGMLQAQVNQSKHNKSALKDANKRGETYIRIPNKELTPETAQQLSIDHGFHPEYVYAYANEQQINMLIDKGITFESQKAPSLVQRPDMSRSVKQFRNSWNTYPTYEQYVQMMYDFAKTYPDICKVQNIGYSVKGRELLFVKISDNVNDKEPEPEFMYSSSMHGDETAGYIPMLRLIDYLLSNYTTDERVKRLVDNIEIWINPLANPDGTYRSGNNTVSGATRSNANGYDINRNFPDWVAGYGGTKQPETLAMMQFMQQHNFVLAANFHGGEECVNYPWDATYKRHPDDNWYQYISHQYADTAQVNAAAGYLNGFNDGITNGADWYILYGGRQDYMNYYMNGREVTIELSMTKLLPASQFPAWWNYNYRSFLNYMEQCTFGIRGIVTAAVSRAPIPAMVEIVGHDIDSSQMYATASNGDYYRPIYQGTYDVRFSYAKQTVTVKSVPVKNMQARYLNVQIPSQGLYGIVSDVETKQPRHAIIKAISEQGDTLTAHADANTGMFNLIVDAGNYRVFVVERNYDTLFLNNIVINNNEIQTTDVQITPINHSPLFINAQGSPINKAHEAIAQNMPFSYCFRTTDPDNDIVNVSNITAVAGGVITKQTDTCFSYKPAQNYTGYDTISVYVCDNARNSLCSKLPIILYINDYPVIQAVDTFKTHKNIAADITISVTDHDSVFLQSHDVKERKYENNVQKLTFTYTPPKDYVGADTITVTVCDAVQPQLCRTSKIGVFVDVPAYYYSQKFQTSTLYPSPFADKLTISLAHANTNIEVVDIMGKTVYLQHNISDVVCNINTTNWKTGMYFVKIQNNGFTQTLKAIKTK